MEDSRQVENLIYSYAERIDNGDLEGVAALFHDAEIFSAAHDVVTKPADKNPPAGTLFFWLKWLAEPLS